MNLNILAIAHHRNGICGAPFDIVLFDDQVRQGGSRTGSRKVAILFAGHGQCAVLDVAMLAASDIAFGSNSWRGDCYEPTLRIAINALNNLNQKGD